MFIQPHIINLISPYEFLRSKILYVPFFGDQISNIILHLIQVHRFYYWLRFLLFKQDWRLFWNHLFNLFLRFWGQLWNRSFLSISHLIKLILQLSHFSHHFEICIFCHSPHFFNNPLLQSTCPLFWLWNKKVLHNFFIWFQKHEDFTINIRVMLHFLHVKNKQLFP